MRPLLLCLIMGSLLHYPYSLVSQSRQFDFPGSVSAFENAIDIYHKYKLDAAEKHLIKLQKQNPDSLDLYLLLARIHRVQKNWGEAKDWLNYILKKYDPENIRAHYEMGICDRESGIPTDPFRRTILWRNSQKHFETVIKQDSTFKNVFLELAWLKRYQNEYAEAIDLCQKQLSIRKSHQAEFDLFLFYDAFIANDGVNSIKPFKGGDQYVLNWLTHRKGIYDRYFIGEFRRRKGDFCEADSVFKTILKESNKIPHTPVYLSRVRLLFEWEKPSAAESTYWQALDELPDLSSFQYFFNDLHYIFSDREFVRKFQSLSEIRQFVRTFWQKKNPMPASAQNARLGEHYRRLIFAEKNFRYDGFRLFANNPDRYQYLQFPRVFYHNRTLNDKGLVYIRFGQPDDRAFELGENLAYNESWLYYPRVNAPKLIFHFEIDKIGGGPGCWRLVPIPTNIESFESRLGWDNLINKIYFSSIPLERQQYMHEMRMQSRENIKWAMEKEFHAWSKELDPIDLFISAARFRDNQEKYRASIAIAAPRSSIFSDKINCDSVTLEHGAIIFNQKWQEIDRQAQTVTLSKTDNSLYLNDYFIQNYFFQINESKVRCGSHIKQLNSERLNGFRFQLNFQKFKTDSLICSDIELAFDIHASSKSPNNLKIIPNPAARFQATQPVFIYYEIYNLSLDENGIARYKINYTAQSVTEKRNLLKKMWSLLSSSDNPTISIQNTRENEGTTAHEYISFDFSKFKSAKMKLKIIIHDIITNFKYEGETEFELVD